MRNLEREIAKVARKAVTKIVKKEVESGQGHADNLDDFLGVKKYRYGLAEEEDQVGVVTGLAYTSVGGELLHIEALRLPGKGRMKTTGKLGDVMKEASMRPAPMSARSRPRSGSSRRGSTRWTSTCTCPKAQRPRTGPRPVWRW